MEWLFETTMNLCRTTQCSEVHINLIDPFELIITLILSMLICVGC